MRVARQRASKARWRWLRRQYRALRPRLPERAKARPHQAQWEISLRCVTVTE